MEILFLGVIDDFFRGSFSSFFLSLLLLHSFFLVPYHFTLLCTHSFFYLKMLDLKSAHRGWVIAKGDYAIRGISPMCFSYLHSPHRFSTLGVTEARRRTRTRTRTRRRNKKIEKTDCCGEDTFWFAVLGKDSSVQNLRRKIFFHLLHIFQIFNTCLRTYCSLLCTIACCRHLRKSTRRKQEKETPRKKMKEENWEKTLSVLFFFFFLLHSFLFCCRALRELVLTRAFELTDEMLQNVKESLPSLSLTAVSISDPPDLLPCFSSSARSLRRLTLNGVALDISFNLNHVVNFPNLRVLGFFNIADVSQSLFDRVCELLCTSLEQLSVTFVNNISSLRCLSRCSRLKYLDLSDCDRLGKDELVHLTALESLVRKKTARKRGRKIRNKNKETKKRQLRRSICKEQEEH